MNCVFMRERSPDSNCWKYLPRRTYFGMSRGMKSSWGLDLNYNDEVTHEIKYDEVIPDQSNLILHGQFPWANQKSSLKERIEVGTTNMAAPMTIFPLGSKRLKVKDSVIETPDLELMSIFCGSKNRLEWFNVVEFSS